MGNFDHSILVAVSFSLVPQEPSLMVEVHLLPAQGTMFTTPNLKVSGSTPPQSSMPSTAHRHNLNIWQQGFFKKSCASFATNTELGSCLLKELSHCLPPAYRTHMKKGSYQEVMFDSAILCLKIFARSYVENSCPMSGAIYRQMFLSHLPPLK